MGRWISWLAEGIGTVNRLSKRILVASETCSIICNNYVCDGDGEGPINMKDAEMGCSTVVCSGWPILKTVRRAIILAQGPTNQDATGTDGENAAAYCGADSACITDPSNAPRRPGHARHAGVRSEDKKTYAHPLKLKSFTITLVRVNHILTRLRVLAKKSLS
jgi:hypothetical protein